MQLLKGKTRQASGNKKTSHKKATLAVGAALVMASSFTSAAAIDGYQQGFEGWYAPGNWVATDDSKVNWNAPGQVTLEGKVKLSILMPEEEEFDVSGTTQMIYASIGGDYDQSDARVYFLPEPDYDDWTRIGPPRDGASISFAPGQWFGIELLEGTFTLTNFEAPAATATVPEPGSLALLGLGLVGLGAGQVHRTRK